MNIYTIYLQIILACKCTLMQVLLYIYMPIYVPSSKFSIAHSANLSPFNHLAIKLADNAKFHYEAYSIAFLFSVIMRYFIVKYFVWYFLSKRKAVTSTKKNL